MLSKDQARNPEHQSTLGADKQYQDQQFVAEPARHVSVAPHVAEYESGNYGARLV